MGGNITDDEYYNFFSQKPRVVRVQELAEQIFDNPNEYLFRQLVSNIDFEEEDFEELIHFMITKNDVLSELKEIQDHLEDKIDYDNGNDEAKRDYIRRISESIW